MYAISRFFEETSSSTLSELLQLPLLMLLRFFFFTLTPVLDQPTYSIVKEYSITADDWVPQVLSCSSCNFRLPAVFFVVSAHLHFDIIVERPDELMMAQSCNFLQ